MTDPPSYDQDLLNRLNALKKSSITLDTDEYVGCYYAPALKLKAVQSDPFHPQDSFNPRNGLGVPIAFLARWRRYKPKPKHKDKCTCGHSFKT
jgi:hypothetical protein